MDTTKLISLEHIFKQYQLGSTTVTALHDISVTINKGEFLAVAGPSGSGKSTLLNLIGCIDTPTKGKVEINNTEVSSLSDTELTRYRRVTVGFIFQSFNLIPVLNVFENIELPLLMQNVSDAKNRRDRVMHFVQAVGLEDRLGNKPGELSGGQRQRVAIARALVTAPLLVLADEPTANLDSATGLSILELMKTINKEEGTTFIFSTHDQKIINYAHRIIQIHDGEIESDTTKGVH